MPIATIFLRPWSDPGRHNFELKLDPSSITAAMTNTGGLLRIPLDVKPDEFGYGTALIALQGWLKLADDSGTNAGIQVPMQARYPNYGYVEVPLAFGDIAHVEAKRASGDLPCHLSLGGLANIPFTPHADYQGPPQAWVTVGVHDQAGTTFVIPREQWLNLLVSAGYARTRLVELPILASPSAVEWRDCTRLLERATVEFRSGLSEPAIATCRQILEGLVTVVAKHWGVTRSQGQGMAEWLKELGSRIAKAWPEDQETAAVLTSLYAAVWSWTSKSHHYGSGMPLHEEAAFAVGLTANLLTQAGHLLQAHPEPLKLTTSVVQEAKGAQ
jgi:hypothetical protein